MSIDDDWERHSTNKEDSIMRCHICDAVLKPHEIYIDPLTHKFAPCTLCKEYEYTVQDETDVPLMDEED
jgi:hypothetical protein